MHLHLCICSILFHDLWINESIQACVIALNTQSVRTKSGGPIQHNPFHMIHFNLFTSVVTCAMQCRFGTSLQMIHQDSRKLIWKGWKKYTFSEFSKEKDQPSKLQIFPSKSTISQKWDYHIGWVVEALFPNWWILIHAWIMNNHKLFG